jgi:hypothetical protein
MDILVKRIPVAPTSIVLRVRKNCIFAFWLHQQLKRHILQNGEYFILIFQKNTTEIFISNIIFKAPNQCTISNWVNGAQCSYLANGEMKCKCPCLFSGPTCQICSKFDFSVIFIK